MEPVVWNSSLKSGPSRCAGVLPVQGVEAEPLSHREVNETLCEHETSERFNETSVEVTTLEDHAQKGFERRAA